MSSDVSSSSPIDPQEPHLLEPQEVGLPDAVEVPEAKERPLQTRIADAVAFFLSALLSPYIVIPVGAVGIIYVRAPDDKFWLWAGISVLFMVGFPVLYILWGIKRGIISDVHVMEREQRSGPFLIAIIGSLIGAILLFCLQAPPSIWGLNIILCGNGVLIWFITRYTKISVHVCVLSATVLGASILHTAMPPFALLWLIPMLIWARMRRQRHTFWQGLSGFAVAAATTFIVLIPIGLKDRIFQFFERIPF